MHICTYTHIFIWIFFLANIRVSCLMFMEDSSSQAHLPYQDPQIHLSATRFLKIYKRRGPCCIAVVVVFYSILLIPFQGTVADEAVYEIHSFGLELQSCHCQNRDPINPTLQSQIFQTYQPLGSNDRKHSKPFGVLQDIVPLVN